MRFQITEAFLNKFIALTAVQFGACALGCRTSFKRASHQHRGQRPSWKMSGHQKLSQAALCTRDPQKNSLSRQEEPPGQNTLHMEAAVRHCAIRLSRRPDQPGFQRAKTNSVTRKSSRTGKPAMIKFWWSNNFNLQREWSRRGQLSRHALNNFRKHERAT